MSDLCLETSRKRSGRQHSRLLRAAHLGVGMKSREQISVSALFTCIAFELFYEHDSFHNKKINILKSTHLPS